MTSGASESAGPLSEVIDAIEDLDLTYHLGGSYASSVHGVPRQTLDADLVVDLDARSVPSLADSLRDRFYLVEERMAHAVARRSSFNLIHLGTGFKVDVFVKREYVTFPPELAAKSADRPVQAVAGPATSARRGDHEPALSTQ